MEIKRNVRKAAELGIAVTAITALLVAGCGGGGVLGLGGGSIVIAGAGNSPFVGVQMTATCANGDTGTGTIGLTNPGDGTISVPSTCTAPILITATGKGKMRPIGAKADGTEDVDYDPAINLPIANILTAVPAAASTVTANPVTTLVADQALPGVSAASSVTAVAAALNAASATAPAAVTAAQGNVETSLGLTTGKLTNAISDYRDPEISGASTRIVEVAAIAVQQAASSIPATVTSGAKTFGQFVAEKLAAAATGAGTLNTAANMATQLNTGANIDIRTNNRITTGSIDDDAVKMGNMVAGVANANGVVGANVGAMLQQINASSVAFASTIAEHMQAAKRNNVLNKASKLVADANSAWVAASSVGTTTRLGVAQAAAAKIWNGMETALAASGVSAGDVIAQYQVIANGVNMALVNDLHATAPVFAAPPTVGVAGVVDALVGRLQGQVSGITATTVMTDAAVNNFATAAMKVTTVMANFAPPPVVGSTVSGVVVTQTDKDAYEAALGAMAANMDDTKISSTSLTSIQVTNLQTSIDSLKTMIGSQISGVSPTTVNVVEYAQQVAQSVLPPMIDFAAPPAPGSITAVGFVLPPIAPPPTFTPPPVVTMTVVTQAQIDAATAAQNQAMTYAATAATQATAAATAASAASSATTVAAAQTAANAAQAAATAVHTARVAADAAKVAAATAFPGSIQASDAAARAAAAAVSDTAAAASYAAALSSYNTLVATLQAAQLAVAQAAAAHAAGDATNAAFEATMAANAATSAVAATTSSAAQPFATSAAAAATQAQTAATHAAADAAAAANATTGLPGSPQATAAAASATAAQTSATAAAASSATAAARVTTLTAQEAAAAAALATANASAVCKVAVGSAVGYVSGYSCTATGTGSLSTNGGGATVTTATAPAGVTPTPYSALLVCDPFGAPPAAGATTLTPCKN